MRFTDVDMFYYLIALAEYKAIKPGPGEIVGPSIGRIPEDRGSSGLKPMSSDDFEKMFGGAAAVNSRAPQRDVPKRGPAARRDSPRVKKTLQPYELRKIAKRETAQAANRQMRVMHGMGKKMATWSGISGNIVGKRGLVGRGMYSMI